MTSHAPDTERDKHVTGVGECAEGKYYASPPRSEIGAVCASERSYGSARGATSDGRPYRECAEHVRQLEGESPFHNLMEVK